MKRSIIATLTLGSLVVVLLTAMAEQPGEKEKGPKKGPPDGKKGVWEPGKVIPPPVRDFLELTQEQNEKIEALEKEVRAKLMQILTKEQLERLREFKGKDGKGPKEGPPDKKGKDKGKDKGPPKDGEGKVGCASAVLECTLRRNDQQTNAQLIR